MRHFLSILLLLFFSGKTYAEGTAQLMPAATDFGYLHLSNKATFTNFGQYGAPAERQIKIRVGEIGETIYWGLNNKLQGGGFVANFKYHILSPSGKLVYEGVVANSGTGAVTTWNQASEGPRQLLADKTKGYDALSAVALEKGDYVIEFDMSGKAEDEEIQIHLFDITVAGLDKKAVRGRLHSKSWQLSTGGGANKLRSKVYPIDAKGVVYEVDFNEMQPNTFVVNFNSFGTSNSGIPGSDRQSVYTASQSLAQTPEFEVFLDSPDEVLYPTTFKEAKFSGKVIRKDCQKAEFCLTFETEAEGYLEGFIDLNNNGVYDKLLGEIYFSELINQPGQKCVEWDGNDASGNPVTSKDIKVYAGIGYNVTHLPLWDVEENPKGFKVRTVRPTVLDNPKIFWDDSRITTGTPKGETNLEGCLSVSDGCHKWTGRGKNNSNSETINTWWYTEVKYSALAISTLPETKVQLSFNSFGLQTKDTVVCKSDSIDFYVFNDQKPHFDTAIYKYEWYINSILKDSNTRSLKQIISDKSQIIIKAVSRQNSACFSMDTLNVSTADPVKIKAIVSDSSCSTTPGSVKVTIIKGPPSPVFTWKEIPTAGNTGTVASLSKGIYNLKIADPAFSARCAKDTSFEIKGGKPLKISSILVDSSECYKPDGKAYVKMKDADRKYVYDWDAIGQISDSIKINLKHGKHNIQVIEKITECKADSFFTIPARPFKVVSKATPEVCKDGKGSIALTLPDGLFNVSWIGFASTDTILKNVPSGIYTATIVAVPDVNCKVTASDEVKNIVRKILPQLNLEPVTCGLPTGTAEVVMPDNRDYLFKWSTKSSADKSTKIDSLQRGKYFLTISENNTNCKLDTSFTIIGNDSIEINLVKTLPTECFKPTGTAEVFMKDNTRFYQYSWDLKAFTLATAGNLSGGNHIVSVEEKVTGCKTSKPFVIDELPLKISASTVGEVCKDSTGNINLLLPSGKFTITWNNVSGKEVSKNNLAAGQYTINVVADTNASCRKDTQIVLKNIDRPLIISELKLSPALCGRTDGTAEIKMQTSSAFVYDWNSTGLFSPAAKKTGLARGNYKLTVMEPDYLCSKDTTFEITGTDPIEITGVPVTKTECYKPTGTASVEMKDPLRQYEYAWDSFAYDDTGSTSELKAGIHIVRVREKVAGCIDEQSFSIIALPLTGKIDVKDELCTDRKGEAKLTLPEGDFKIFWNSNSVPSAIVKNLAAGDYTIRAEAVNDATCVFSGPVKIKNVLRPVKISDLSVLPSDCGLPTGEAEATLPSDGRKFVYEWDSQVSTFLNSITGLEVGKHNLKVHEDGTNCSIDTNFVVKGQGFSVTPIQTPEICEGKSGSATVKAVGANLKIIWSDSPVNKFERKNISSGKYSFTVLNGADVSCKTDGFVEVKDSVYTVPASFEYVSTAYKQRMQAGAIVQFTNTTKGNIVASHWEFGNGSKSDELNARSPYAAEGDYKVKLEVKDTMGCTGVVVKPLRIDPFVPCGPALPDAFSPNEDKFNDHLRLLGFSETVDLKVFNRWGEVIFRTDDFDKKWEGDYRGEQVPIGVYPFQLEYECPDVDGNLVKSEMIGEITLLR